MGLSALTRPSEEAPRDQAVTMATWKQDQTGELVSARGNRGCGGEGGPTWGSGRRWKWAPGVQASSATSGREVTQQTGPYRSGARGWGAVGRDGPGESSRMRGEP